jgi:hypothetical protein
MPSLLAAFVQSGGQVTPIGQPPDILDNLPPMPPQGGPDQHFIHDGRRGSSDHRTNLSGAFTTTYRGIEGHGWPLKSG